MFFGKQKKGSFSTGSPEDSRFHLWIAAPNADLYTYYYSKLILTRKPQVIIGERLAKQKHCKNKNFMLFPYIISGVYEYIPNNVSQSPSQHPPYFDTKMERNVTSFVSQSTHLECKVHNLGDKTVSLYHHTSRPPEIYSSLPLNWFVIKCSFIALFAQAKNELSKIRHWTNIFF